MYLSKAINTIQSGWSAAEVFMYIIDCNCEISTFFDCQYIQVLTQIVTAEVRVYHLPDSNCRLCELPHPLQYNLQSFYCKL